MCSFQDYAIKHGGNFYKEKAFQNYKLVCYLKIKGAILYANNLISNKCTSVSWKYFFEVLFLYANFKQKTSLYFELLELKLVLNTIITVGELLQSIEISKYYFQNLFSWFENTIETSQPTIWLIFKQNSHDSHTTLHKTRLFLNFNIFSVENFTRF